MFKVEAEAEPKVWLRLQQKSPDLDGSGYAILATSIQYLDEVIYKRYLLSLLYVSLEP